MTLREAIERYILWRKAHGAKFTSGANLLRHSSDMPMGTPNVTRSAQRRFWPFWRARDR